LLHIAGSTYAVFPPNLFPLLLPSALFATWYWIACFWTICYRCYRIAQT